jgi:hypothetical protein
MNDEQKSVEAPVEDPKSVDLSASPQAGNDIDLQDKKRYRLATDVDLSKAKKNCKRCFDRGINGYTRRTEKGVEALVPIVCRCVTRNGGVKENDVDRLMRQMSVEAYMNKIRIMPPCAERDSAIQKLQFDAKRPELNDEQRRFLNGWIEKLTAPPAPEA